MSAMARWTRMACALLAVGCAEAPPRARAPASSSADLGAWISASEDEGQARVSTLSGAPSPSLAAAGPATIREHVHEPPRPRRGKHVDVSFQGADMVSAFQFLADAGRFNLVMQDGMTGQVSASMRSVDPYDALLALAHANGIEVRLEGDIV